MSWNGVRLGLFPGLFHETPHGLKQEMAFEWIVYPQSQEHQRPSDQTELHGVCTAHSTASTVARLVRKLVDPVGFEHTTAVLPKTAECLREILTGSPVISFDNMRRISREAADTLAGAREGLHAVRGRQRQQHDHQQHNYAATKRLRRRSRRAWHVRPHGFGSTERTYCLRRRPRQARCHTGSHHVQLLHGFD